MTPQTRRNVLRYGIAIDLVIVATGVGMLIPPSTLVLLAVFGAAVLLSTWKGGWQGGLTALALSAAMLAAMFAFHGVALAAFSGAMVLSGGALAATLQARTATAVPATPEVEERAARERAAQEQEAREREERAARKQEARAAKERARAEAKQQREEAKRMAREREEREREERERGEREREERAAKECEEREREERAAKEREEHEREERAAKEREEREREERAAREREEREREERAAREREQAKRPAPPTPPPPPARPQPSLLDTLSGWLRREPQPRVVNLTSTRRVAANGTTPKRPARAVVPSGKHKDRRPRLVFLERRRGTADTVVPRLRQRGIDVSVVERWVDAVDELLRLEPDAFFVDVEHPDFEKAHRVTTDKSRSLPIVLTGRSAMAVPANVRYAAFAVRPYDLEDLVRLAQQAMARPDELLALQTIQRVRAAAAPPLPQAAPSAIVVAPLPPPPRRRSEPASPAREAITNQSYEVLCYTCGIAFNAIESDWCSCLAKERTLVCTNCLACFCKAPPAYKEKFWVEAPPRLFERKSTEVKRQGSLSPNPPVAAAGRPLVLTVEDDEEIQAIVQRVCANLGYGFVHATNGQDGLDLAHEYRPDLILSDAFMPKLDGREMCRMLKEEGDLADTRMVVMTGLYTDTKYRSEALKRFHVDDYIAKPVSITDLINILQRHLEGVSGLPVQDDLHELHRQDLGLGGDDVTLADVLAAGEAPESAPAVAAPQPAKPDAYRVSCYNCEKSFDAAHAEWCRCVGRDNTLVCDECGGCFCKAPAAYKERFWIDAPPSLFERKMIGSKRSIGARSNPSAHDVKRPLILLVEDDENVQLIVRTVVTNMGYGFVVGADGQEGLNLAREYTPDLILSDAFMPRLDGREMCRLLKEDPMTAGTKAIIMTGLYTDRKYRNEALDYFKVDDYVAKPLAVDDLIKLFKKHLPLEVVAAH